MLHMMAAPAVHMNPGLGFTAALVSAAPLLKLPAASRRPTGIHHLHAAGTTSPLRPIACSAARWAPVDNGSGGGKEVGPYAHLWPWGDYIPGGPVFAETTFEEVQERFSRESKEALAALKGEVAGFFRPLLDNFQHLRSLKTGFDTEDYHIGMPFGALIACFGCYHLSKMNPSMFLDAALGYAFYRLSVVSLQLRRKGFSNDLITRVKFVILIIMAVNDIKNKRCLFDAIRMPVYFLYLTTFLYEVFGIKKYVKYFLGGVFFLLQIEEGREILGF